MHEPVNRTVQQMYLRPLARYGLLLIGLLGHYNLADSIFIHVVEYIFHLLTGAILGLNVNHSAIALAFALAPIKTPSLESIHIQFRLCLCAHHVTFFICPWTHEYGKKPAGDSHRNGNDKN